MNMHGLDMIYRKMNLRSEILPAEIILVVKDFARRIDALEAQVEGLQSHAAKMEEQCNECRSGMEKATKAGPGTGGILKKKVPASRTEKPK